MKIETPMISSIFICSNASFPMQMKEKVKVRANYGIEGDSPNASSLGGSSQNKARSAFQSSTEAGQLN